MSRIVIEDISQPTTLDGTALAGIVGGMQVQIDKVSTTVQSADDQGTLAPDVLSLLVGVVVRGLRG
jgi:hypothetical protein